MAETAHTARVKVDAIIPGAPKDVFDAWVNPAKLAKWFCGSKASSTEAYVCAHEGGCYFILMKGEKDWPHAGHYTNVTPGERLSFTWYTPSTDSQRSDVDILFEKAEGGVRVTIIHKGLPDTMGEAFNDGWAELLENLKLLQN